MREQRETRERSLSFFYSRRAPSERFSLARHAPAAQGAREQPALHPRGDAALTHFLMEPVARLFDSPARNHATREGIHPDALSRFSSRANAPLSILTSPRRPAPAHSPGRCPRCDGTRTGPGGQGRRRARREGRARQRRAPTRREQTRRTPRARPRRVGRPCDRRGVGGRYGAKPEAAGARPRAHGKRGRASWMRE